VSTEDILNELAARHPSLVNIKGEIERSADLITECFKSGGKLLICGNGGSSSDSDHIAGELMKGFEKRRLLSEKFRRDLGEAGGERGDYLAGKLQQGLPAISLAAHSSLMTAVANDIDPDLIFAQQVVSFGTSRDILLAISTSGNSRNVIDAVIVSKAVGMTVIGLTGETGGRMREFCDVLIMIPERNTAFVQELHLPVYHTICRIIESEMFS
jgi:phosphoheptose isomerase